MEKSELKTIQITAPISPSAKINAEDREKATKIINEINRLCLAQNNLETSNPDDIDGGDSYQPKRPPLLSLKEICQNVGVRPSEFKKLVGRYPDLQNSYEDYLMDVESDIDDLITMGATQGDIGFVNLYIKRLSYVGRKNAELEHHELVKAAQILSQGVGSSAQIKADLIRSLQAQYHLSLSKGKTAEAAAFAKALSELLNLKDMIEVDQAVGDLSVSSIADIVKNSLNGDQSDVTLDVLQEAAAASPSYSNILPLDSGVRNTIKNITNNEKQ